VASTVKVAGGAIPWRVIISVTDPAIGGFYPASIRLLHGNEGNVVGGTVNIVAAGRGAVGAQTTIHGRGEAGSLKGDHARSVGMLIKVGGKKWGMTRVAVVRIVTRTTHNVAVTIVRRDQRITMDVEGAGSFQDTVAGPAHGCSVDTVDVGVQRVGAPQDVGNVSMAINAVKYR
jgi:hypothetical protein